MPWLVYKHSLRSVRPGDWPWAKPEDLERYTFSEKGYASMRAVQLAVNAAQGSVHAAYGVHYVSEADLARLIEEIGEELYPYEEGYFHG